MSVAARVAWFQLLVMGGVGGPVVVVNPAYDDVWHAPMRETHGMAQQRVTITRCQSRRVTSRGVGRVTMAHGRDRNITARVDA